MDYAGPNTNQSFLGGGIYGQIPATTAKNRIPFVLVFIVTRECIYIISDLELVIKKL